MNQEAEKYKNSLKQLSKLNKNLSRKKNSSNSRRKTKKQLAKLHDRIVNQRSDFQWKLAHELCKHNSHIGIEDLNLKGMQRVWGRKISDLSYAEFITKLMYIAEKYKATVVKIGRYEATSQVCSCCGYRNSNTKNLKTRTWVCPECGSEHDRDINAAINLRDWAIKELSHNDK